VQGLRLEHPNSLPVATTCAENNEQSLISIQ
jgi:hypothetical protein